MKFFASYIDRLSKGEGYILEYNMENGMRQLYKNNLSYRREAFTMQFNPLWTFPEKNIIDDRLFCEQKKY